MLALAVPGSSIPGPVVPEAIVAGTSLELVETLLGAGIRDVLLACSADALRHALAALAGRPALLVVDRAARPELLEGLKRAPELLSKVTVAVLDGTLPERERDLLSSARTILETQSGRSVVELSARARRAT